MPTRLPSNSYVTPAGKYTVAWPVKVRAEEGIIILPSSEDETGVAKVQYVGKESKLGLRPGDYILCTRWPIRVFVGKDDILLLEDDQIYGVVHGEVEDL